MPPAVVRKTSTKVVDGEVRTKSRFTLTSIHGYSIEKLAPGRGFKHVVSPRQLSQFIEIIPDWENLSYRLRRIELAPGYMDYFGYHTFYRRSGVALIALNAWPKKLWTPLSAGFFRRHRHIFEALQVPYEIQFRKAICRFTVAQARAFSLLHVFLHEVGHHHDWLHRRGTRKNVEGYADDFADSYLEMLLPIYKERFGDPARSSIFVGEEDVD